MSHSRTRNRSIALLAGAAVLLIGALIAGCGGGGNDNQNATAAAAKSAPAKKATVNVANTSLGKVLVDSRGHTLYDFAKDTGAKSMCSGECATEWPPLHANGKPTVSGGASAALVGTIKGSDGAMQVTYHGHPLYGFSGDHKPGDANGQGLNDFGGVWWAVSPAGNSVLGKAGSSGAGGSGY
jgi:predicted lipoprotein with Yx(FWY)xxD motif